MKVLHLIGGGDIGGAKFHVLSLVKELSKYIDVKIISFRSGVFSDEARAMGINIEVVKTRTLLGDIKRVVRIVRNENYQIIHSHGAKANMVATFAKHFTSLPSVTTVHSDYRLDYLHSIPKMFSFGLINMLALRFLDYYIGVSKNFKEMLISRKFNPGNIFTVYNGIDFDSPVQSYSRAGFSNKYNLNLKDDDVVVGILARLHPVKGVDTFIDAAKEVLNTNPKVKFIIGGDGKERKALERRASDLGISDNLYFLGWVNDSYEFMSNVDINVLTSLSETFPYVILEGVRFKKATISSDVGGISDLIDNGENGYLFKVGDYKKLAEYVTKLVSDDVLRKEMGEKIYDKAKDQFSLKNMYKTQLEIYKTILASSVEKRPYDVIISGWHGFGNIGDDAMLKAVINDLHIYKKDTKLVVYSRNPYETKQTYGVDSVNRFNIFRIILTMKNAKLFLYGGGTLIQESTSTRSLMYYLGIIWIAKKMGLKVMLYANGIEPINKYINKKLTQKIMNQVEVITLREELSLQELKKLFVNKPRIVVTADPALTIKAENEKDIDSIFTKEGIGSHGPYVGFSVRNWDGRDKYETIIAQAADHIIEQYGAKPVFIPMLYPDDLHIIEKIISRMKGKGYVIRNRYREAHVLGIIKRMEMLVGMRLHSLVFAASHGIPVIGLVYATKIEGFLQYIQQSGASAGHVKQLEFNKLKDLINNTWDNRHIIKKQLEEVTVTLKEKAMENAKIAVELIEQGR